MNDAQNGAGKWDEKAVFACALHLDGDSLERYLDEACPTDEHRQRILALLAHAKAARPPAPDLGAVSEFRLIRLVGEGGMGTVYEAHDTALERRVALKILAPHLASSERARAALRHEARVAAGLNHPSIIPVYRMGSEGDKDFIVSEFVDGPTLSQVIEQQRGEATRSNRHWYQRCAVIVAAIADALECAHRSGLVHRDVKPSNILLAENDLARLTDFGISIYSEPDPQSEYDLTKTVIGSCYYMSPEQAAFAKRKIDRRSDIFSLGVVLYEMLTLQRPFDGPSVPKVLEAVIAADPVRAKRVIKSIPTDLDTICHKALERDPSQRYQTAAHMASDLRCWLEGSPILARRASPVRRARLWVRRHRLAVNWGAAASLAILCLVLILLWPETPGTRLTVVAPPGSHVYTQRTTEDMEYLPPVQITGSNLSWKEDDGALRVTVVSPQGAFAEFDLMLDMIAAPELTLHAVEPSSTQRFSWEDQPGLYVARLIDVNDDSMVTVPAGSYRFGVSNKTEGPWRDREVFIESVAIDAHEVTIAEYARFLDETGYPPPTMWDIYRDPNHPDRPPGTRGVDLSDRPVVNVTMEDAAAYARWVGKRLPTVFEWEALARGPSGKLYPWGDTLPPPEYVPGPSLELLSNAAVDQWEPIFEQYVTYSTSALLPGPTDQGTGAINLFGNVKEWTSTWSQGAILNRGGCWIDPPAHAAFNRNKMHPPWGFSSRLGFRCAKSVEPVEHRPA